MQISPEEAERRTRAAEVRVISYHCIRWLLILLRATYEAVANSFKTLIFTCAEALAVSVEARERRTSNADGAGPGCHNKSVIPAAGPSKFPAPPPFASPIPAIPTPLPPAATKEDKGKGKKRQAWESPDRERATVRKRK